MLIFDRIYKRSKGSDSVRDILLNHSLPTSGAHACWGRRRACDTGTHRIQWLTVTQRRSMYLANGQGLLEDFWNLRYRTIFGFEKRKKEVAELKVTMNINGNELKMLGWWQNVSSDCHVVIGSAHVGRHKASPPGWEAGCKDTIKQD